MSCVKIILKKEKSGQRTYTTKACPIRQSAFTFWFYLDPTLDWCRHRWTEAPSVGASKCKCRTRLVFAEPGPECQQTKPEQLDRSIVNI